MPAACTTRPASKSKKAGASAAITVPARKSPVEAKKICRVLKRSSRYPVVGMTTPMVSMKPVVSHCAAVAGMEKSAMTAGNATDNEVSFRIMIMAPKTRIVRLITTSRDRESGAEEFWDTKTEIRSVPRASCSKTRRL